MTKSAASAPFRLAFLASVAFGLAACGQEEPPLPGERLDIRAPLTEEAAAPEPARVVADKLALPPAFLNTEWTHRNGEADHLIGHPALGRTLKRVWSANIGAGNSRKRQITADPIVAEARIYTMDAIGEVRAFTLAGKPVWARDLTPPNEKPGETSGGGLAYAHGVLAATTGHGDVWALDPATGEPKWRHRMPGSISAPPVIVGDVVVAVTRSNTAMGIDIRNGRILWQQLSPGETAGVEGAGAPAAMGNLAVIPYASGEVVGVVARNGLRAWSAAVTGGRKGLARSIVNDISGDPVIDGYTLYVGNQAGRIASLDRRSGERNWTAQDGTYTPVWPLGGAVFVVTDTFAVKRLNASDGGEVWSAELPGYKSKRDRRRRDAYAYFGPVVAGGQVWVAGSDGLLRAYDPESGALTFTTEIPGGAASQPAIAGGVLYILSANGQLHAFR